MTDDTQPEAMDLADWLEAVGGGPSAKRCAALLREQHTRIAELESELEAVGAGGVQALSAAPGEPPGIQALMCVISSLRDIAHFSDEEGVLTNDLRTLRDWAHAQTVAAPQPSPTAQAAESVPAVDGSTKWFTVIYKDISPGDEARLLGEHPKASAMSWSHALHDRDAARAARGPAEQQAAPKTAPGVGSSGFDYQTAADFLSGKTVSDEAVRKFVAASRWAHDERAALSATLLAMHGVLTSREAEIALLKKALLEAEAAPQQEAQEPVFATYTLPPLPEPDLRDIGMRPQDIKDFLTGYATEYAKQALRFSQPAPAPLSEMPYEKRKAIQEGEQIGASDAWFHARHNMLDTLDRRNVFRAGFDRGWNAAIAAQGGKDAE